MPTSDPVMAAQLRRLLVVSELPNVTMQVVPECVHAGLLGGFLVADGAAYVEVTDRWPGHVDQETVTAMSARFDSIRSEAMRASESLGTSCGRCWHVGTWRKSTYSNDSGGACLETTRQ